MNRLFTWFRGRTRVEEVADDAVLALTKQVLHLGSRLEQLVDAHEQLKVDFRSFRGRVYAWKGKELPAEATETPQELPLTDPRLTKAQVRERLLKAGRLKPN